MIDSKTGDRMLAYVQQVLDVEPLYLCDVEKHDDGTRTYIRKKDENGDFIMADAIEKAHVLGWTLIVKKGEFKPGDKCVFFEIDSKLPSGKFFDSEGNDVFGFMEPKHYNVKTYKLDKFGIWSQGLILPLSSFDIDPETPLNENLTERLGITYSVKEDNSRKANIVSQSEKSYMAKHRRFFGNRLVKSLMKHAFFRSLFLRKAHKTSKDIKTAFPSEFVSKTDEERIQNMPYILEDKRELVATEKIDGTSTTWLMVRKPLGRFEFYVCSRNRRLFDDSNENVYMNNDNIYWENAKKYDVENQLRKYLNAHKELKWVCIQGESYGEGWQGNPLKMRGHHFAAFNFKDSENGRWGSLEARELLSSWDTPIPWVPILDTKFVLPDTVEELLNIATAKSRVNPFVLREGIVFRSKDGKLSFKAVSPEYLMKHNA